MTWGVRVRQCCWLFIVMLTACGGRVDLRDAMPGAGAIPGWSPAGVTQVFNVENLYDLVDGQADAFFAYGFEQVAVQTYNSADGESLRVEVWQLATPADAYGLFASYRAGRPVPVGNEADTDPGRRLDFWQNRYFVRVYTDTGVDDATLKGFAGSVSDTLPSGGERPALLDRLPQDGLIEGSDTYFHQEISIQDRLWLGGQNLLGLSPETSAVLARYDLAGDRTWLLLVEYPDDGSALAGKQALQAGGIDDIVSTEVQDNLLGAVFGPVDEGVAQALLAKALQGR